MSRFESNYRKYERMSSKGVISMSNSEIVEEAIDTIKIGKRKSIAGKDLLESFFNSSTKEKDQSICREGLIDTQNGVEMLIKGIIEYYGESYIEEHYTDRNASILESLDRDFPNIKQLSNVINILSDDDFSFTMYKCSKFPRYSTFKTNGLFRKLLYTVVEELIKYVDNYILVQ